MSVLHDPTCIAKRQNCGQEIRRVNEKFRGIVKKLMGLDYVSVTFPIVVIKHPVKATYKMKGLFCPTIPGCRLSWGERIIAGA